MVITREGADRPQERHRHRHARRSAAPEGRWPSSPTASRRACTRRSSTRSRSTARTSTSPTTAPARCTSSTSTTRPIRSRSAAWKTPRADAGRMLHDIDVQDGMLYAQLVERRAGDPRRRQRDQGRHRRRTRSSCRSTSTTSTRSTGRSEPTAGRASSAARTPRGGTTTTSSWPTRCSASDAADALFKGQPSRAYGRLQVLDVSDIDATRSRWRGTSRSTAACITSGSRAIRCTWAPTTRASGVRHLGRAARRSARAGARDRARESDRPARVHAQLADDVGRGGEERPGYVNDFNNGLCHRADGAARRRGSREARR